MTDKNYINLIPQGKAETPYQIPLFSPADEAGFYHRSDSGGYFSLLTSFEGGRKVQHSYPTLQMPVVLGMIDANRDTWISQAEFWSCLSIFIEKTSNGDEAARRNEPPRTLQGSATISASLGRPSSFTLDAACR